MKEKTEIKKIKNYFCLILVIFLQINLKACMFQKSSLLLKLLHIIRKSVFDVRHKLFLFPNVTLSRMKKLWKELSMVVKNALLDE